MNRRLTALLGILCVGCIVFAALQQHRIDTLARQLTELRERAEMLVTNADQSRSAAAELKVKIQDLQDAMATTEEAYKRERQYRIDLENAAVAEAVPSQQDTTADKKPGARRPAFMEKLGKMMEDPDMRDAMRSQQRLVLDMLYGPLLEKLGLNPEESGLLKDLLVDRQMAGMSMFGGGDPKELGAKLSDLQKQADDAIRSLLGEERYGVYEDYQATIGERMIIKQLNDQLAAKSMALDEAQREELITLMVEERVAAKLPSAEQQQQEWAGGLPSDAKMDQLFSSQEAVNRSIQERAVEMLSSEQSAELQRFLENQIKMQRIGIQMMKSMMGGDEEQD